MSTLDRIAMLTATAMKFDFDTVAEWVFIVSIIAWTVGFFLI